MSSELELLKQRITELEAENAELRKENTVIPDLRNKLSVFDAERAEFKRRIAEALRTTEEERARRVAENAKLKARIEEMESEFRDRITKVEQRQVLNDNSSNICSSNFNSVADQLPMVTHHEKLLVDEEMDTSLPEEPIPEAIAKQSVSAVNIPVMDQCDQTPLEDKKMDSFLDGVDKEKVSNEIRQRNREKKLLCESSTKNLSVSKGPASSIDKES